MTEKLDEIRRRALDRIDRAEKVFKWAIVGAALLEGALFLVLIYLTDFSDPLHLLIFFGLMLVYNTLAVGLIALGAQVGKSEARILKAVELMGSD